MCKVQENQRAQEAPGTKGKGKGIQQLWQSSHHPGGQEAKLDKDTPEPERWQRLNPGLLGEGLQHQHKYSSSCWLGFTG